jgi:hypothetical protein
MRIWCIKIGTIDVLHAYSNWIFVLFDWISDIINSIDECSNFSLSNWIVWALEYLIITDIIQVS